MLIRIYLEKGYGLGIIFVITATEAVNIVDLP